MYVSQPNQEKENESREGHLLFIEWSLAGIEILSFISLYALPNPVCFGSQIRDVFRGTRKSQCLKVSSLVIDSLWSLAWHGVGGFPPIPI